LDGSADGGSVRRGGWLDAQRAHQRAQDDQRGGEEHQLDTGRTRGIADQHVQHLAQQAALGEQAGGIPHAVAERGQHVGRTEEGGALRGHAGSQQQDQPARHAEQVAHRDGHQAEVDRRADRQSGGNAQHAAQHHAGRAVAAADGHAVEEQHDFGPFAQQRDAADQGQRMQRPRAGDHVLAQPGGVGGQVAPVAAHPDVVPAQHRHGGKEDGGVEQFLADALHQGSDLRGETGHDQRAEHTRGAAAEDPERAVRHAARGGHDDTDDEAGLEDFTKDDDQGCEHVGRRLTWQPGGRACPDENRRRTRSCRD